MKIQVTDKHGKIITQLESLEPKGIAIAQATRTADKLGFYCFVVYVNGVLDSYSEPLRGLDFPATI